jgi:hypothetical protein
VQAIPTVGPHRLETLDGGFVEAEPKIAESLQPIREYSRFVETIGRDRGSIGTVVRATLLGRPASVPGDRKYGLLFRVGSIDAS